MSGADEVGKVGDGRTVHMAVGETEDGGHRRHFAHQTEEHKGQKSLEIRGRGRDNGQRLGEFRPTDIQVPWT
jgi:hypothetical protein